MLLRERVRRAPLLVQEMELAAKRRHAEALTLLLSKHWAGAAYLFGYETEILLKIAVYRRLGARPSSQTAVFFRRARERAKDIGLAGHIDQFESGHGSLFWARLVWCLPTASGGSLPSELRRALLRHVLRIEQRWAVEMRYFPDPASTDEAVTVLRSVEWISRNRVAMWS